MIPITQEVKRLICVYYLQSFMVISFVVIVDFQDQATAVSDRKTTYTQLRIDVTDGDDLPPIFEVENCVRVENICFHPTYTTEVTSNAVVSTLQKLHLMLL